MLRIFSLIIVLIFLSIYPVRAEGGFDASLKQRVQEQNIKVNAQKLDRRALILNNYFQKYDSPLQYQAQDFIDAADTFGIDWRLVPAIAGVESTFGKNTPGGYNSWGWGVYGSQALYFKSWRDGIFTVSKGLKENYINKGFKNPYQMNAIYASSPYWGGHVDYFLKDLSNFEKQSKQEETQNIKPNFIDMVAGKSGQLSFNN